MLKSDRMRLEIDLGRWQRGRGQPPRACARPAGAHGARARASMERSPRHSRPSRSTGWRRSATTRSTSPSPTAMPAESIHGRTCKRSCRRMAAPRHRLRRARPRARSFTADHANDERRQDRSDRDRSAGHRRRHRRPDGGDQGQGRNPAPAGRSAGEGERQAQRRHLDGHGRAEQRRHSRLRHAGAVHQGDHHRQRRHRPPEGGHGIRAGQLPDDRASSISSASSSRRTEPAIRRHARCTTWAPMCCRCRRATTSRRCCIASCGALQVADHQPLHGDAAADRPPTAASPARSASTPAPPNSWWSRAKAVILCLRRRRPARPAGLGLSVRHLRERGQFRRRLRHGLSRRRRARRTSNASRSIR